MTVFYWILCLFIALIPAYFVFRNDKKRTIPVKWLPALLRLLSIFFTAALLLAPPFSAKKNIEEKPIVLWLQDESSSIKEALKNDSSEYRNQVQKIWASFGNNRFTIVPLGFGTTLTDQGLFSYRQNGTDIAKAIRESLHRYQSRNVAAIVIASDGNYNIGNNPIYSGENYQVPIYTIGLGDSTKPSDLSIPFTKANKSVILGNNFELLVNIQAEKLAGKSCTIQIRQHNHLISEQNFSVNKNFYNNTFRFYLPAGKKGLQQYTVLANPLPGEKNTNNNYKKIYINVVEKNIDIIIAASAPHPDIAAIKEALSHNPEYKINIQYGKAVPASISGADLLITHDLPDNRGISIPKHGTTPTWNILGPHTNCDAFSKEQNLLQIQSGNGFNDAVPVLNPDFNLFVLPKDILEVTARLPPLKAPNGDYQFSGGEILFRQGLDRKNENPPLWIIKHGTSPQAILCGTGIWRWRLYSFKNFNQSETVDNLIQQTVNLLSYQANSKPFKVSIPKYQFQVQEPIPFNASFLNEAGTLTNVPNAMLIVKDSGGIEKSISFQKSGKSYSLKLNSLTAGEYSYEGKVSLNGKTYSDYGHFSVTNTSLEQLKSYSDFALLYKLANNSGGQFFNMKHMNDVVKALNNNPQIKPMIHEEQKSYHWIDMKWFFFIILTTATAEWFLRKYWGLF